MNYSAQEIKLSELERLEFNRRIDVANAVVHGAARVFCKIIELDEVIEKESKTANSIWYLVAILGGLAMDYFLSDSGHKVSLGGYIAFISIALFAWKKFEIVYFQSRRDHYNERLYELEVIWSGAIGTNTFWSISSFAHKFEHDRHNDQFQDWWLEQSTMILERVQVSI